MVQAIRKPARDAGETSGKIQITSLRPMTGHIALAGKVSGCLLTETSTAKQPAIRRTNPMIRWTPKRKAALLHDIETGMITEAQARRLHDISAEELLEWRRHYVLAGVRGMRVTRRDIR